MMSQRVAAILFLPAMKRYSLTPRRRETIYHYPFETTVTSLLHDLQHAWRIWTKRPGLALTILVTLALGIGATTALFSIVEGVLLRPLPFRDPDRLVQVWTQFPELDRWEWTARPDEFLRFRDEVQLAESSSAYGLDSLTLTGLGNPIRLRTILVTANLLETLGVEPAIGRSFLQGEDVRGAERVAMLSHRAWRRLFGGDPGVLGRTLMLDGEPHVTVGVTPPSFNFPDNEVDLYVPYPLDDQSASGHYLFMVSRLRAGASLADLRAELEQMTSRWIKTWEHAHPLGAEPLEEKILGDARAPLLVLLSVTAFVLLIACVNVAGLLLAHGEGRRLELSVRATLGAVSGRLIRQQLVECALLGVLGGVLGLLVAHFCLATLRALEPGDLPRIEEVGLNMRVLAFTLGTSLVTSLVVGALPALHARRRDITPGLREGGRSAGPGLHRQRLRRYLVVFEIGVAVTLVAGAVMLLQGFWRLQQTDTGVDTRQVLTGRVMLPVKSYPEKRDLLAFFSELHHRLRHVPGVSSASLVNFLPFLPGERSERIWIEGRPLPPDGSNYQVAIQIVTVDYFKTMGVSLLRGRGLLESDRADAPRVVVISDRIARDFFPDESPIGSRLTIFSARPLEPAFEIVGVVSDILHKGPGHESNAQVYLSMEQGGTHFNQGFRVATAILRTDGDPVALTSTLRRQVWEIDPDLSLAREMTLEAARSSTLAQPRFSTVIFTIFGVLALALATVGTYGLLAHLVGLRRKEFGIRLAMGASRAEVVAMVVRQGLALAVIGLLFGGLGVLGIRRLVEHHLFTTESSPMGSLAATMLVLLLSAFFACWVPARRAARVDPSQTLRQE